MKQVYLDYSATTPVKREVLSEMLPYFTEHFGNPSSLYTIGMEAKEAIDLARSRVASLVGAQDREIYFTSGGTEADNWALMSAMRRSKGKGNHIITTSIEHHAILHTCEFLEKEGYQVTYLPIDHEGRINLAELEAAITDQTVLISVMFVNNEVGTIQPIKEIGQIAKKHQVLFHTDAVQALGNVPIDVKELGVDMLSMSAHKIYGPKGIGALYIRKGLVLPNLIFGGAQEKNKRSGTENVTGIVGFGKAAELSRVNMEDHLKHLVTLRDYFIQQVQSRISEVDLNGSMVHRHPGNVNLTFNYVEGEALLLYLDIKGIYVSTGSACSSASFTASHVLQALGLPMEKCYSSLRFSIGDFTTKEDLDHVLTELEEIIRKLRAMSPFNKNYTMTDIVNQG